MPLRAASGLFLVGFLSVVGIWLDLCLGGGVLFLRN